MTQSFNPVFFNRPKSIFPTMSALAREYDAINLGQGFPDQDGPQSLLDIAAKALQAGPNQYAPVEGIPELRQAIAADNKRFYDLDINPYEETLVTSGATEALAAAFLGFLKPGDEVILFAPFYECYAPQIEATGAHVRLVSLKPPHWEFAEDDVRALINDKTRLLVINTPHNPLGKVMSEAELAVIARIACDHDLTVICDEVYEHLIFDDREHKPLMTFPGMRPRCIRIGSAGKTFSVTGFRIGYVTGPVPLISAVMKAHQFLAYTSPAPLQKAVAAGMAMGDDYYQTFRSQMQQKRDLLHKGLKEAGFTVLSCAGTYFLTVDINALGAQDDMAFCREITEKAKVAAVPLSAFYHPMQKNTPTNFIRFCFCKKQEVLDEACSRLRKYFA